MQKSLLPCCITEKSAVIISCLIAKAVIASQPLTGCPHRFPLTLQLAHNSMGHSIHYHIILYLSTMQPPKTSHSYTIPCVSYPIQKSSKSPSPESIFEIFETILQKTHPPFFLHPQSTSAYKKLVAISAGNF